jgi:glycerol-3-phosphate dehydrogenase (NAD(P)+)
MLNRQFGVIGGGSWATALVKILTDNGQKVNWWVRSEEVAQHIHHHHHNPNYISSISFDGNLISVSTDLEKVISTSDTLLLAVPSAYIKEVMSSVNAELWQGKTILSAIKGLVQPENQTIADFLTHHYQINPIDFVAITGPCHAEEVASEKLSYLTFSNIDINKAKELAQYFSTPFLQTRYSIDVQGVEFASVLKNIYALCVGMSVGLGYGDNFRAVLVSNAMMEMSAILKVVVPACERDILLPSYLGDTLVTAYSPFSRNRTFGIMIGKGYSVHNAILELNMVAEGYYATKALHHIVSEKNIKAEILEATYMILYGKSSPQIEFNILSTHLL